MVVNYEREDKRRLQFHSILDHERKRKKRSVSQINAIVNIVVYTTIIASADMIAGASHHKFSLDGLLFYYHISIRIHHNGNLGLNIFYLKILKFESLKIMKALFENL